MTTRLGNQCAPARGLRTGDDASARPVRTCVGCRRQASSPLLWRLRLSPGGEVVSGELAGQGRGAWIHPDPDCVRRAVKARAFARAFRRPVACTTEGLLAMMGLDHEENGHSEIPGAAADKESGLEADGHPMSTQR